MKPARKLLRGGLMAAFLALGGALPAAPAQDSRPGHSEGQWFRNGRQLTSVEIGLARSGEAYFSPDGQRISFLAYPIGKQDYQTYVMNVDGTGLKMVSTGTGATACPYFHPSGEKLIFAANHHDLRPADKPHEREPMRPRHGDGAAAGHQPGGHPGQQAGGTPGEQGGGASQGRYVWTYYPGMDIFEYTFASGQLKRLTFADGYDAECAYAPDGQHIVFSSLRDGNQEIYICDADGRNPRRITRAAGPDGGPFFSPDGKRIVYRSDRRGSGMLQIFVNNVAGTDERALTGDDLFHWAPYWHPSGQWIIFTLSRFRHREDFDLYLLRDDGSEMYQVTIDRSFDGLPVFSPDGRYLMWTSKRNGLDTPQVFIAEFSGLTPAGELRAKAAPCKVSTGSP